MLLLHISIALFSLVWTAVTWFAPSQTKLKTAYGLTAATLASGTYLVISLHQPLVHACMSGLLYLGVSLTGIVADSRKLARQENR